MRERAAHDLKERVAALEVDLHNMRKDNEHLRDAIYGNGDGITLGAVWTAFVDFRKEMRDGFLGTHARQDKTNGTLRRHEWQIAFASGGVAVISFLVAVFGVYLMVRFG